MKYFLFVIASMLGDGVKGQTKLDNTLIVRDFVSMSKIKEVLFNNGYSVEGADTNYFSSSVKAVKNSYVAVKMLFYKTDTSLTIKGLYKTSGVIFLGAELMPDLEPIKYVKSQKGTTMQSWNEVDKIA